MKNTAFALFLGIVLLLMSCSDGTQMSTKLNTLIGEKGIEQVIIIQENNKNISIPAANLVMEGQFLVLDNTFLNLGKITSLKVDDKTLTISY